MTPTETNQKIEAAKKITAAFLPFHKIHLEEGYVQISLSQLLGSDLPPSIKGVLLSTESDSQIWAIDSKSRLVMI